MENQSQKREQRRSVFIYLFVGLILANLLLLYLVWQNGQSQLAEEQKRSISQKDEYESSLKDIEERLRLQIKKTNKLETENGAFIDSLQANLEQVMQERDNLKNNSQLSQRQMKDLRDKIQAYEILLIKKDEQIEKLRETADILYKENNNLKEQKNELTSTITELGNERSKMQGKLDEAAVLKTENVVVNAVDNRGKEQSGGQYRANKIDRLSISFNLADNKLSKIGNKDVYMRVLEPAGTILINPGSSGKFEANGREVQYSVRKQILFDNSRQTVNFEFSRTGEFEAGKHTVEFYTEGYRIGYGTFEVR